MALIPDKIINLLQYRIKQEEQSSRIYKAMSVWLELAGYDGSAKLWNKYSGEELSHADWARKYLLDLNILPVTPSQEQPDIDFKGLPQIIALTYKHETEITDQCKELAKLCLSEGDLMTFNLAQKYITEQVEEIVKSQFLLDQLELYGNDKIALQLLDTKLGSL